MGISFNIDVKKVLNLILYVAYKYPSFDIYFILKTIYCSDKEHLLSYGMPLIGDNHIAMKYGPVPSLAYDIIKIGRGYPAGVYDKELVELIKKSLVVQNNLIILKTEPDQDYFSEIEKEIIKKYGDNFVGKTFEDLKNATHDTAYLKTLRDDVITYEDILEESEYKDDILSYIQDYAV